MLQTENSEMTDILCMKWWRDSYTCCMLCSRWFHSDDEDYFQTTTLQWQIHNFEWEINESFKCSCIQI